MKKALAVFLSLGLLFQQIGFAQVAGAELNLAGYLNRPQNYVVPDTFRPLHLRYFSYDGARNQFQLLLDKGDVRQIQGEALKEDTRQLLDYFLIGVTLPNDVFWVNLRPDAPDMIIDPVLAQTDVGKIFLEADLQLKKDTARFTSPETPEGRAYWDKLYKKAAELFGTENVTIPTLTRPWIVPGEIIIRETEDSAYIYKASLKVMLESDYLKSSGNPLSSSEHSFNDPRLKALNEYSSQIIRETIIPKLTKDINIAKRYASLRQVFYSLILSRWFKARFSGKSGAYASLINTGDLSGLTSKTSWSKTFYFKEYQKSFKDGEYNIREPIYTPSGQSMRSYFSGGLALDKMTPVASISSPVDAFISRNINVPGALNIPSALSRNSDMEPFWGKPAGPLVAGQAVVSPMAQAVVSPLEMLTSRERREYIGYVDRGIIYNPGSGFRPAVIANWSPGLTKDAGWRMLHFESPETELLAARRIFEDATDYQAFKESGFIQEYQNQGNGKQYFATVSTVMPLLLEDATPSFKSYDSQEKALSAIRGLLRTPDVTLQALRVKIWENPALLNAYLRVRGTVQGSNDLFEARDLVEIIQDVRAGGTELHFVTQGVENDPARGLRDVAQDLKDINDNMSKIVTGMASTQTVNGMMNSEGVIVGFKKVLDPAECSQKRLFGFTLTENREGRLTGALDSRFGGVAPQKTRSMFAGTVREFNEQIIASSPVEASAANKLAEARARIRENDRKTKERLVSYNGYLVDGLPETETHTTSSKLVSKMIFESDGFLTPQPTENTNAPGALLTFLSINPGWQFAERKVIRYGGQAVALSFNFAQLDGAGIKVSPGGYSMIRDPDTNNEIAIRKWGGYDATGQPIPLSLLTEASKREVIIALAKDATQISKPLTENELTQISRALALPTGAVRDVIRQQGSVPVTGAAYSLAKPASSPMQDNALQKAGGIDFRSMEMMIQPMGRFNGLNFTLPALSRIKNINVDEDLSQIRAMLDKKIMPSGERIKELLAAVFAKNELDKRADDILLCLVDICRLEEELVAETSPQLREALVIFDTQKYVVQ